MFIADAVMLIADADAAMLTFIADIYSWCLLLMLMLIANADVYCWCGCWLPMLMFIADADVDCRCWCLLLMFIADADVYCGCWCSMFNFSVTEAEHVCSVKLSNIYEKLGAEQKLEGDITDPTTWEAENRTKFVLGNLFSYSIITNFATTFTE